MGAFSVISDGNRACDRVSSATWTYRHDLGVVPLAGQKQGSRKPGLIMRRTKR